MKTLEDYENKILYAFFRDKYEGLLSEIAEYYLNEEELNEYQKLLDKA